MCAENSTCFISHIPWIWDITLDFEKTKGTNFCQSMKKINGGEN